MSPSASPPTRVPQGASPELERRADAFLDAPLEEDIWSGSESDGSDSSESDACASYETDESGESRVDMRVLEELIARLHARGPEFVRPKTTQKHQDIHSLVAAAPRARRPEIVPPGSVPGLLDPVLCGLLSEGLQAQREGLSWMKPPGPKGVAERGADAKGKRRADEERSEEVETTRQARPKKRKWRKAEEGAEVEVKALQDRLVHASRPLTQAERERRGREVRFVQRLAARRDAEASDDDDDATDDASDVAATASVPNFPSFASHREEENEERLAIVGDGPDVARNPEPEPREALRAGRVRLTVCWRARTRARSSAQPTSVSSVLVDVLPGETCMRFVERVVHMPPGGVYVRDTQLSWGDCILDPARDLAGARAGSWALDLRREPPCDLVLRVPVGAALAHRALREAAGEPVDDSRAGVVDGSSGASGLGSRRRHRNNIAVSIKDLSNRALHPGRTDPEGMAALLRSYGAIKDDAACSLVDVGSGDGHFALGLARAFPNVGVCGIEPQKDLYEESLRVAGRDCNFIHGLAENELRQCASARVVMATTHNFDASSIESIVRAAARLPAVTHLVVGQASLCTARCKAAVGPCCCFVPLGSEEVSTHWGNSRLAFSVYQRVARWVLDADSAACISDPAALAALERGKIEPFPFPARDERDDALADARKREVRKQGGHEKKARAGRRRDAERDGDAETSTPPQLSEAWIESPQSPEAPRSPVLESSPGYISRLLQTVA